jgi:hypothetical protein
MTSASAPQTPAARHGADRAADPVPMPGGVVSFLGRASRGGDWLVPAHFRVVAVLGVVRLDLRHAQFASSTTTIEAAVFAGHLEIGLPSGFRVDYAGDAFGGKFEYHTAVSPRPVAAAHGEVAAPVIRIIGKHVGGAIDIYENPQWDSMLHALRRAARAFRD